MEDIPDDAKHNNLFHNADSKEPVNLGNPNEVTILDIAHKINGFS